MLKITKPANFCNARRYSTRKRSLKHVKSAADLKVVAAVSGGPSAAAVGPEAAVAPSVTPAKAAASTKSKANPLKPEVQGSEQTVAGVMSDFVELNRRKADAE